MVFALGHLLHVTPLVMPKRMVRLLSDYDPQFQAKGFNYGFVEYDDPAAAERAMQTLNGRRVHQSVSPTRLAEVTNIDQARKSA